MTDNKDYSQEVEKLLKKFNIEEFNYSQCENRQPIARGGFSLIYSIVYHGKSYALKCLNNNLGYDDKSFKLLEREGLREKTVANIPSNYVNLYKKCWSFEPSQRPTIDFVLNELEKLQTEDVTYIEHELFIDQFSLNKGRNFDNKDFVPKIAAIIGNNGYLEKEKINLSVPIIFLPKESGIETQCNDVKILIPILSLHYQCDAIEEFVQDIRDVLEHLDSTERSRMLKEKFDHYGNYIVTSATVGGVITIKDWSKIDDVSRSRLKTYLQWSIEYAKGIRLKNFEDAEIDDLNLHIDSKNVQNAGNLYKWIKDLYNYKCLEIISYEKFKPTYQLLPEDLIQKTFEFCNFEHTDDSEIISRIHSQYDKKSGLEWVTSPQLPLMLYICDWIQDNSLQYGVILRRSKFGRAKKAAFKFLKEPKITRINKITVILTQPKTRQEAYLLENGIILKEEDGIELEKIPFTEHILDVPLEDFKNSKKQFSNAIYCQIIFHTIKISFDISDIEYLQEFSNAVDLTRQDQNQLSQNKNLCKLFGDDYGHLLPRTLTLGGVLSKKYISNNHPTDIPTQRLDLKDNDPGAHHKIEQVLETWNKEFKDVNTFYFLNNDGDVIYRNNIGDWMKTLAAEPKSWSIVSSEDWMQIYKVLKKK
ncbi:2594_t:CDS:2 [Cetraspora pellucida]|uniref:2594_t:CDS:1 n=1 Tax=Cetraspora pellucida TaxID=1433469 RepID=A0A9N9CU57_9GLOM|nr:2594_t:CDS:2 [Cetraspora pellucida]